MKKTFLFAAALGSLFTSFQAKAEEGFFLTQPALQTAWDNSVFIALSPSDCGGNHSASGTLLREEKIGNKFYLYVLTAGHIANALGWKVGEPVLPSAGLVTPKIYKNAWLPQTALLTPGKPGAHGVCPSAPGTYEELPAQLTFAWGYLSNDSTMQTVDAAILVFEEDHPLPGFLPLTLGTDLETAAGAPTIEIGFPAVAYRPVANQRVPIEQPSTLTKRWSQGSFNGQIGYNPPHTFALTASTTDALPGNSGGGIFNQNGHLIGVASIVSTNADSNWAYDATWPWTVAFVSINAVNDFVSNAIEAFKKNLP